MLSVERQKQLMGCSDSSCMAEIAGALDVDGVVVGSLARLGESYLLSAQYVDSRTGTTRGHASRRKKGGKIDDVLDELPAVARELLGSSAHPRWSRPGRAAVAPRPALAAALPSPQADLPATLTAEQRAALLWLSDGAGHLVALLPAAIFDGVFFFGDAARSLRAARLRRRERGRRRVQRLVLGAPGPLAGRRLVLAAGRALHPELWRPRAPLHAGRQEAGARPREDRPPLRPAVAALRLRARPRRRRELLLRRPGARARREHRLPPLRRRAREGDRSPGAAARARRGRRSASARPTGSSRSPAGRSDLDRRRAAHPAHAAPDRGPCALRLHAARRLSGPRARHPLRPRLPLSAGKAPDDPECGSTGVHGGKSSTVRNTS